MSVKLIIEPKTTPLEWNEFLEKYPKNSIALDGFVKDVSMYDKIKNISNFNHHEKVNRLATRSTCAQLMMAIRMGLYNSYTDKNGNIDMNIFVNDCDEDVCVSWFLLKYGMIDEITINPILNTLVSVEDSIDTTSGAYPFPKDSIVMKELSWLFDPYHQARFNGKLRTKDPEIYKEIILEVESRILDYISGNGQFGTLDSRYNLLKSFDNWVLVEEIGMHSRTGMMSDGIQSFVSVKSVSENKWIYTIGKVSLFVKDFDLFEIFKVLNEEELKYGNRIENDFWGGSDIIGGSPRVGFSSINPERLIYLINSLKKGSE